ncbi:hypothetical protein RFI_23115 [Reticulomyxa filosa]|uniref:Uncharacterized protein n=1 Tax=Reticulomyxa filosa TaxID=46433 RepID=X6MK57_RETFI|nr:hypothetical protein RFI_23115 [Reticulomyxa filosa]|eukprot:ETO14254.1 hypothetical protein RFI_23115 [Reticulomyxa filosa]
MDDVYYSKKCSYHFCWVCLLEWNTQTHNSFYTCGNAAKSVDKTKIQMEEPTADYLRAYQEALNLRAKVREERENLASLQKMQKRRIKSLQINIPFFFFFFFFGNEALQHEHASIFLETKYFDKPHRLKTLLKHVRNEEKRQIELSGLQDDVPEYVNMEFIQSVVHRMVQAHLLISRGYKFLYYYDMSQHHVVSNALSSLESVIFKLDVMFTEPTTYLPARAIRWKWYDLGFYIELGQRNTKKKPDTFLLGRPVYRSLCTFSFFFVVSGSINKKKNILMGSIKVLLLVFLISSVRRSPQTKNGVMFSNKKKRSLSKISRGNASGENESDNGNLQEFMKKHKIINAENTAKALQTIGVTLEHLMEWREKDIELTFITKKWHDIT